MDECKGLMGKLFGHKFKMVLVKSTPPNYIPSIKIGSFEGDLYTYKEMVDKQKQTVLEYIESLTEKEYRVMCTRCGLNFNPEIEEVFEP